MNHQFYMEKACQEALKAADEGEVPIGAVIVKDGAVIGRGFNKMESLCDATAHAEIIALSAASTAMETWRLNGCTLYVTLEPCLMCLGAILQSRIDAIVYGAYDTRLGAIDTFSHREQAQAAYGRFPHIEGGIMARESLDLIRSFFENLRKKN
jgi:tRNA(adenine34) deaminase